MIFQKYILNFKDTLFHKKKMKKSIKIPNFTLPKPPLLEEIPRCVQLDPSVRIHRSRSPPVPFSAQRQKPPLILCGTWLEANWPTHHPNPRALKQKSIRLSESQEVVLPARGTAGLSRRLSITAKIYDVCSERGSFGGWAGTKARYETIITATDWTVAEVATGVKPDRSHLLFGIDGLEVQYDRAMRHKQWILHTFISLCIALSFEVSKVWRYIEFVEEEIKLWHRSTHDSWNINQKETETCSDYKLLNPPSSEMWYIQWCLWCPFASLWSVWAKTDLGFYRCNNRVIPRFGLWSIFSDVLATLRHHYELFELLWDNIGPPKYTDLEVNLPNQTKQVVTIVHEEVNTRHLVNVSPLCFDINSTCSYKVLKLMF